MLWRTIIDERGQRVRLYQPGPRIARVCRVPPEEFEEMRRAVCAEVDRGSSPFLVVLSMTGLGLFLGLGLGRFPLWMAWGFLVLIGMAAVWCVHDRRRLPTRNRKLIARALLDCGRCASCAYPLRSVQPDDDGLTICPECRSAWCLQRMRVALPLE